MNKIFPIPHAATILRVLLLIAVPLVAYIPVMNGGFIWDDNHMVYNNPLIHAGVKEGLGGFWFTNKNFDYFPLTSTTLWIEWRLFGRTAAGYHVVNILLHVGSAFLIWRILKRLRVPAAWFLAMIFSVHPVAVASVAWIAERKNTLAMLFYLVAFLAFLRYEDARQERQPISSVARWYLVALVCFVAALVSKTAVVTLPVVLLLLCWWRRGRITRADLLGILPLVLAAFALGLVTLHFQYGKAIGPGKVREEGLLSRFLGMSWCLWWYQFKALVPTNLMMVNPRWTIDPARVSAYLPMVGHLGLLAMLLRFHRTWGRPALVALGYHVLCLAPVLGLLKIYFMRFSLVGDHWHYFAFMGPVVLVTAGVHTWLSRRGGLCLQAGRVAAAVLVISAASMTWHQSSLYADEKDLWVDNIRKNPEAWVAHNNYATLAPPGSDEAVVHFREALRLNPRYHEAYFGLGRTYRGRGQIALALESFEEAVSLRPDYFFAHNSLGLCLMALGDYARAESHFKKAVAVRDEYAEAWMYLGIARAMQRNFQSAEEAMMAAIKRGWPQGELQYNYATYLAQAGRYQEAMVQMEQINQSPRYSRDARVVLLTADVLEGLGRFDEAVRLCETVLQSFPDLADAHNRLGRIHSIREDYPRALQAYRAVVRLRPELAEGHHNLGITLLAMGRVSEAIASLRHALEIAPSLAETHHFMGQALQRAGRNDEARAVLVRGVELAPKHPLMRLRLAETLAAAGKIEASATQYDAAFRLMVDRGMTNALTEQLTSAIDACGEGQEALKAGLLMLKQKYRVSLVSAPGVP